MKHVDLTQTLSPGIPDWNGCCGFDLVEELSIQESGVSVQSISTPLGIGTHMDAPCHFIEGARDISALTIEELILPAVILDVRKQVHADYFISLEDIEKFEAKHGPIANNTLVLGLTGWSQYWTNPIQYRGEDESGHRHFPGFSQAAIDVLLKKEICGIGIDTLSPDGSHIGFPVHHQLLSAEKYIIENLCNLESLPPIGSTVTALPLKIKHGSEAPCRVIAELP